MYRPNRLNRLNRPTILVSAFLKKFKEINSSRNKDSETNWIMGELLREMKGADRSFRECPVTAPQLAALLKLVDEGRINRGVGKAVLEEMFRTGKDALTVVEEKNLSRVGGGAELEGVVPESSRGVSAVHP